MATRKPANKATPRRKPAPKVKTLGFDAATLDAAVSIFVNHPSDEARSSEMVRRLRVKESETAALLVEVRQRLAILAGVDVFQRVGENVRRLDELYRAAFNAGRADVALAVVKEQNKFLGLYHAAAATGGTGPSGESDASTSAVIKHLEPLGLAAAGTDVVELARLAAQRIINGA